MRRTLWALVMLAVLVAATDSAFARRGGGRGGGSRGGHSGHSGHSGAHHHAPARVAVGGGFAYSPWYLAPRIPYVAPEPSYPIYYVEKGALEDQTGLAPTYWYFCPEANAYYPEILSCPQGWEQFVSQAP